VEGNVGGDSQPLSGHRPRAEDFIFAERFEGGNWNGGDGDSVADSVEDLDGIAFRAFGRDVVVHELVMSPRLRRCAVTSQVSMASV